MLSRSGYNALPMVMVVKRVILCVHLFPLLNVICKGQRCDVVPNPMQQIDVGHK